MKIRMHVKDDTADWWEDYDVSADNLRDAKSSCERMIAGYNSGLRVSENVRTLLEVVEGGDAALEHAWSKVNIVTLHDHRGVYDYMRCSRCGCEGRRCGLSSGVKRGAKWRAKKWDVCPGTPVV